MSTIRNRSESVSRATSRFGRRLIAQLAAKRQRRDRRPDTRQLLEALESRVLLSGDIAIADYFPTNAGFTWVYATSNDAPGTSTDTTTVENLGMATVNGFSVIQQQQTVASDDNRSVSAYDTTPGNFPIVEVRVFDDSDAVVSLTTYTPPLASIEATFNIGDDYDAQGDFITMVDAGGMMITTDGTYESTIEILRFESVTVAAGTFDALVVKQTDTNITLFGGFPISETEIESTTWLVECLGPVKTESISTVAGFTINSLRELTSFDAAGSTCEIGGGGDAMDADTTVESLGDDITADDMTTLREAILFANDNPGPDVIDLSGMTGTITLTNGLIQITDDLTIIGPGGDQLIIDGNNAQTFVVDNPDTANNNDLITVTMSGLTITGGNGGSGGGAINNREDLTLDDMIIRGNVGVNAAVVNTFDLGQGNLTVRNSTFSDNIVNGIFGRGGAIQGLSVGSMVIENTTFANNSSAEGGAIYVTGSLSITGSTFTDNAGTNGGAIFFDRFIDDFFTPVSITNSTFTGNNVTEAGGAFYIDLDGGYRLEDLIFDDNTAGTNGGAIFSTSIDPLELINTTISNNNSGGAGAGIYLANDVTLTITDSAITGNTNSSTDTDGGGGGVHIAGITAINFALPAIAITNSTIAGNTGVTGGGLFLQNTHDRVVSITDSTISGNNALLNGGGLAIMLGNATDDGASFDLINSTIANNNAGQFGGGAYFANAGDNQIALRNSTIAYNRADVDETTDVVSNGVGAGVFFSDTVNDVIINSTIVADNNRFPDGTTGDNVGSDAVISIGVNNSLFGPGFDADLDLNDASTDNLFDNDNPGLSPLADNGGDTQTIALTGASPALNAGANVLALDSDQRGAGFSRVEGAAADIGAFELDVPIVTIESTTPDAAEGAADGQFTIRLDEAINTDLVVSYAIAGSATNIDDYAQLTGVATILAGETSVTVDVAVVDDDVQESAEDVTLTLNESASYALGAATVSTVTIAESDVPVLPIVSIAAISPDAAEGAADGEFLITLDAALAADITLNYTITGSATNGDDYATINGTATILAGDTSVSVVIDVTDDEVEEAAEDVILTIDASGDYVIGDAAATVTIAASDIPLPGFITGVAFSDDDSSGTIDEGEDTLTGVSVTLFFDTNDDGSLDENDANLAQQFTGDDGSYSFEVQPGRYFVVLADPPGFNPTTDTTLTVEVAGDTTAADNDFGLLGVEIPVITIETTTAATSEEDGAANPGQITLTRDGTTAAPLTVTVTIAGTATPDGDYITIDQQVTFDIGESTVILNIVPVDDDEVEVDETVIVTLVDTDLYNLGAATEATVTITDNDVLMTAEVSGIAFDDTDNNGDQDAGELGIAGLTVTLYRDNNGDGALDAGDESADTDTTDDNGAYSFGMLAAGDYLVDIQTPAGFDLSTGSINPLAITLADDQIADIVDVGFFMVPPANTPDIVPQIDEFDIGGAILPGLKGKLEVDIVNIGSADAKGKVDVEFYISTDDQITADDISLGSKTQKVNLKTEGNKASKTVKVNGVVPSDLAPGTYYVGVIITGDGSFEDASLANNVLVIENTVDVITALGDLGDGDKPVKTLNLVIDGNEVQFKYNTKGTGRVDIVDTADGFSVNVTGEGTTKDSLQIIGKNGTGVLTDVTINTALKQFKLKDVTLAGNALFAAGLQKLDLTNVTPIDDAQAEVQINDNDAFKNLQFKAKDVTNLTVLSDIDVKLIKANDYRNTNAMENVFEAPEFLKGDKTLKVKGLAEVTLVETGIVA